MKGFRKLVMLGVLLVTLLLIIDTIDAGKKQGKKKELETGKSYDQDNSKSTSKNKHTESIKHDKVKKTGSQRTENYEEDHQHMNRGSRFESKKPDVKKNVKFASKEKKYVENEKTKTSKHFQKFKKSKVLEEEPVERFVSSKTKGKKTSPQYLRSENDQIFKTVKKTTQKKLIEENENVEKIINEELNRMKNEEADSAEETIGGNPKKRKYKLVEVVLEEDGQEEEEEGNETPIKPGPEDQEFVHIESEEITEKTRSVQNPKFSKNKKSSKKHNPVEEDQNDESASEDNYFNNTEETAELEFSEGTSSEVDNFAARYTDQAAESCQKLPEDPNRQGHKKLTLYVLEEKIDGQIRKRVVSEEDGVTMCEVADLLRDSYNMAIPED